MTPLPIRTPARRAEVAWFAALCSDDFVFLGVADPMTLLTIAPRR